MEVIRGLVKNDIVAGARLVNQTGIPKEQGNMQIDDRIHLHHFTLYAPFSPQEQVGELQIKPNRVYIERLARQAARVHVGTLIAHSLAITGLVIFLVNRLLTKPLTILARELHLIRPGSGERLTCPSQHEDDEIGQLVYDSNSLLDSVQNTLERERKLRDEVESLGRRFRLIFENASSGILLVDNQGRLHLFNPAFAHIIGPELMQQLTHSDGRLFSWLFEDEEKANNAMLETLRGHGPITVDLKLRTSSNNSKARMLHCLFSKVTDEESNPLIECIANDISERALREQRIRFEAEHDPLTKLLNRRAGKRCMVTLMEQSLQLNNRCAILLIDLDRFKAINDTHGHEVGDLVLIEVANRLLDTLRREDLVIRWGGDEFLVMLQQGHGSLKVDPVASKVIQRLCEEIDLGEDRLACVGASIGIALFPDHSSNMEHLVELADSAMYRVKQHGRGGYCVHQQKPIMLLPE
jgi:diguanylate cyclase (GGDEF)-like protein/PAS domain S-box-containing protein